MTTPDFIIALFYAVDQEMLEVPKHPHARLYPSEVVTLAWLYAMGVIAPFPNLTSLDIGTHKEFSLTV
jgi:hypothetical protein